MLRTVRTQTTRTAGGVFAIVASRYNARYVDGMLVPAVRELKRAGASQIRVIRVPGAFEIPIVAKRLARTATSSLSAIICLGVILRGETTHAAHIGEAVNRALMEIQLAHEIPVVHAVLLLENESQARVRCLGRKHNRGAEAAQTALVMARVLASLRAPGRLNG